MEKKFELRTPLLAEEISVIHVVASRGDGTPENIVRNVDQYWSKDGKLLAEKDPFDNREVY